MKREEAGVILLCVGFEMSMLGTELKEGRVSRSMEK